jgi:predicted nucleic acid-binding protein
VILLDTNVLSELRKIEPTQSVVEFAANLNQAEIFTSVICIGELAFGIARLPTSHRSRELADWLTEIEVAFGERVLAPDVETAHAWAELSARLARSGRSIPTADSWIAATTLRHGLTLATRNVRDFQHTGVVIINPWEL